ncbi:unnamed protein product [Albugo candida]|uniref:OTU domain-containing protein n=1 Tax=Albugo candida TaxID=65357 RepID=A0A024FUQ0_9STRA|nr:unnamed protein product [Albugo candida]|eukprot:CCI10374.1 unnamed protein product [Albugo candida]
MDEILGHYSSFILVCVRISKLTETASFGLIRSALSDQLYGGQHLHQLIRRRVVDYIIEKRCLFEPFLEATESFDHYVERMRQDGVWGGNQEIFAASQYFDADILIHQSASVPMLIEYDGRPQRLVHLYFSDSEHYDSIRALGDIETSSPPKRINLSLDGFRTEDFEARWRKRQKDRIETAKAHKTSPSVISVMPIKSGDQDVDQITSSLRKTVRFRDILPPTIATSRKELRQKKKELIRERCP